MSRAVVAMLARQEREQHRLPKVELLTTLLVHLHAHRHVLYSPLLSELVASYRDSLATRASVQRVAALLHACGQMRLPVTTPLVETLGAAARNALRQVRSELEYGGRGALAAEAMVDRVGRLLAGLANLRMGPQDTLQELEAVCVLMLPRLQRNSQHSQRFVESLVWNTTNLDMSLEPLWSDLKPWLETAAAPRRKVCGVSLKQKPVRNWTAKVSPLGFFFFSFNHFLSGTALPLTSFCV
eukprot:m.109599 g.109599  ORF g.109599 m.109599 type:complete len:240 (+) comp15991_c0_seq1:413-1132(+)